MYLTQSDFLSTASLALSLALHLLLCFSQEKPVGWKEINTHIHTPGLVFAIFKMSFSCLTGLLLGFLGTIKPLNISANLCEVNLRL